MKKETHQSSMKSSKAKFLIKREIVYNKAKNVLESIKKEDRLI